MKRPAKPKGNPYVANIKDVLAYARKRTGNKKLKRAPFHRILIGRYRFEFNIGLQDIIPLKRAAELICQKPYMLFIQEFREPFLVTYADYDGRWFALKSSPHLLHPAIAEGAMTDDDAIALFLPDDNAIVIQSGTWSGSQLWILIPQEDYLKHENTKP